MRSCSTVVVFFSFLWGFLLFAQDSPRPRHATHDWSNRAIIFTGLSEENLAGAIARDPRALHVWVNHAQYHSRFQANLQRDRDLHSRRPQHRKELQRDWSMSLGGGPIGPWSSPAKFSFDINAAPDCTKDFVVFPTNNADFAGSTNGLPTLIAFNNLYTGPGPSGICPTPAAPAAQPSVLFAYNTATVPTGVSFANISPELSLDGTKVAFVENNTGGGSNYAAFHVLTWKAGEGTRTTPALPGDCASGNSCMTTLVLSTTTSVQHASPFIDYAHDTAYVADFLSLHKITPVFNGTPQEVSGNGWPVAIQGGGSPVYDSVSGRIFLVTNSGGSASFTVIDAASGSILKTVPLSVFSLSDPIVDSTNQTVFIFYCASPSFHLTVEQFDTSGNVLQKTAVGPVNGNLNVFMGDFDNQYYNNPSTGTLYFAGAVNFIASLYGVGFTGTTMNSSASGPLQLSTNTSTSIPTPLTEIYNPNLVGSPDRLFVGLDADCASGSSLGCMEGLNITSGLPSGVLSSFTVPFTGSSLDISGIVVDNVSSLAQASSIYFVGNGVAYKLTQSALQ